MKLLAACLLASLVSLGLTLAGAPAATSAPPEFRLRSELELPAELTQPRDVRWLGPSSVVLTTNPAGVVELPLAAKDRTHRVLIPGDTENLGGLWRAQQAAVSERFVAASAPVFSIAWRARDSRTQPRIRAFDAIADFDLRGSQVLLLGGLREAGVWCPDGAIAWLGDLDEHLEKLKPVYFSRDGAKAPNMGRCGILGLGAVRFLPDGSFVVAPGVEDGVYLYGPDGAMVRTWDSSTLGFFSGCPLSDDQAQVLSGSERKRFEWLDGRPVLDDIVPIGEDPGLVIRRMEAGSARWDLVVLHRNGKVDRHLLPFRSNKPLTHLQGDARGGELVFLLFGALDYEDPTTEHRLLFVEGP